MVNLSSQINKPINAAPAVPTPDHIAYPILSGIILNESVIKNNASEKIPNPKKNKGSFVKPAEAFNNVVPIISVKIANPKYKKAKIMFYFTPRILLSLSEFNFPQKL